MASFFFIDYFLAYLLHSFIQFTLFFIPLVSYLSSFMSGLLTSVPCTGLHCGYHASSVLHVRHRTGSEGTRWECAPLSPPPPSSPPPAYLHTHTHIHTYALTYRYTHTITHKRVLSTYLIYILSLLTLHRPYFQRLRRLS